MIDRADPTREERSEGAGGRGKSDRRHPDLLTAAEAAEYLCLEGPRSIQRLRQQGRLEPVDLGRRNLYHRSDLDAFVDSLASRDDNLQGGVQRRATEIPTPRPSSRLASPGRNRKLQLHR